LVNPSITVKASFPLLVSYIEIFRKIISTKETNKGIESISAIKGIESSVQSKLSLLSSHLDISAKLPSPKWALRGCKHNRTEME
jgi:hypothetical protein